MGDPKRMLIRLEMTWWLITAILAIAILLPIYLEVTDYLYLGDNLLFIVAFITLTRLIFFLKYTLFANNKKIKIAMFFLCLLIVFILIQKVNQFQIYIDENGMESIVKNVSHDQQAGLLSYIRKEMLFFGVGSAISAILLPLQLIKSIWHDVNPGN